MGLTKGNFIEYALLIGYSLFIYTIIVLIIFGVEIQ